MTGRMVTHLLSTMAMTSILTISCKSDWSVDTNRSLTQLLSALMLILDQILERRLISFQNSNQMSWIVRFCLIWSSMSIDDQLLMMYHWCWLYELAFWYMTHQYILPRYFRIRAIDSIPFAGIVPWFVAYGLIQCDQLTNFLRDHRTSYLVAAQTTCAIMNYLEHPKLWKITYFMPTITGIVVFGHRPDHQLLSLMSFIATCNMIDTYEHIRIQILLNVELNDDSDSDDSFDGGVADGGDNVQE